jgi:TetR/AcrR family transcriptional regulator, transcriptional repressor of aconitase
MLTYFMRRHRLHAQDRRAAIIMAIRPLIARRGLNGTTTREMAAAAGVSEALIFKHFPTKQALYEAIVQSGAAGEPALERLLSMTPSTATLVHIVKLLVGHFAVDVPRNAKGKQSEHRLLLANLLEDSQLARLRYDWIAHNIQPLFAECVRVAEAAGDLVASPVLAENRLWFAEHLGAMFASLHLGPVPAVPYASDADDLARQLTWFLLRGIGIVDTALAVHCGIESSATKTSKRDERTR